MASPEKALCDKIITTSGLLLRSTKQVKEFLLEDLRIERSFLQNMKYQEISKWVIDAPKKSSLDILIKTLKEI
jgi:ribosomal protein S3